MNILVFEYITGGGMVNEALAPSLVREGDMMLRAVVNEFSMLGNTSVSAFRDHRLHATKISANDIIIAPDHTYIEGLAQVKSQLDAVLIIAPETNGILYTVCQQLSQRSFLLLNSELSTIALTSNKLDTFMHLQAFDIPQIPAYMTNEIKNIKADRFVVKPVDGAGCDELLLLDSYTDLLDITVQLADKEYIVQPFIEGRNASLSLLCRDGKYLLLTCNEQILIERNGGLGLKACKVNAFEKDRFQLFCNKLVQALPKLRGYIGVDIIITEQEILLVEINPRLTTSYAGIQNALGINTAKLMLQCFSDQQLPVLPATTNNEIMVEVEAERAA